MFVDEPDKSELRQGDIIKGLFYPLVDLDAIRLIGEPAPDSFAVSSDDSEASSVVRPFALNPVATKKDGFELYEAQLKVFRGNFIVLSQCCDLALNEKGKHEAHAFVLSPLINIPYPVQQDPEKLAALIANTFEHYVNFFFISQKPPLQQDYAVDFGRLVSVVRAAYPHILKNKVLQMTDEHRMRLKIKFGSHFGRPTKEEIESGIYDAVRPK
jgi:hypothetical protein